MKARHLSITSLLVLLLAGVRPHEGRADPSATPPTDASAKASKLFDEAQDARAAKDFETCVRKAEEAFNLFPQSHIRGLQGVCESELGRFVEAATHLAVMVEGAGPIPEDAKKAFVRSEARVTKITVACKPADGDIVLDGRPIGKAPLTIYVEPGERVFVAKKEGHVSQEQRRSLIAGARITLTFDLDVATKPAAESLPMWPAGVGFGVAGAGALLGGGMLIASAIRGSDANQAARDCPNPADRTCDVEGQRIADEEGMFQSISVVGWIVAGAGLAFAIPYTIAASNSESEQENVVLVPLVSPTFQGASITARF